MSQRLAIPYRRLQRQPIALLHPVPNQICYLRGFSIKGVTCFFRLKVTSPEIKAESSGRLMGVLIVEAVKLCTLSLC